MRLQRVSPRARRHPEAGGRVRLVDRNVYRMQEAARHAQKGGEVAACVDDCDVDLEIRLLRPAHCRRHCGGGGFPMHNILRSSDIHQVKTDRNASFNLRS